MTYSFPHMSGLTNKYVETKVNNRRVLMFAKANDVDSQKAKQLLDQYGLSKDIYEYVDIEKRQDCRQLENYLRYICFTDRRQVMNQLKFVK